MDECYTGYCLDDTGKCIEINKSVYIGKSRQNTNCIKQTDMENRKLSNTLTDTECKKGYCLSPETDPINLPNKLNCVAYSITANKIATEISTF